MIMVVRGSWRGNVTGEEVYFLDKGVKLKLAEASEAADNVRSDARSERGNV